MNIVRTWTRLGLLMVVGLTVASCAGTHEAPIGHDHESPKPQIAQDTPAITAFKHFLKDVARCMDTTWESPRSHPHGENDLEQYSAALNKESGTVPVILWNEFDTVSKDIKAGTWDGRFLVEWNENAESIRSLVKANDVVGKATYGLFVSKLGRGEKGPNSLGFSAVQLRIEDDKVAMDGGDDFSHLDGMIAEGDAKTDFAYFRTWAR